jgi:hypothetical protein
VNKASLQLVASFALLAALLLLGACQGRRSGVWVGAAQPGGYSDHLFPNGN